MNAAEAATIPINVTFKAPFRGGCPVALLLKYPKMNRQIIVNSAEIHNP
jgi:hypothetical protein